LICDGITDTPSKTFDGNLADPNQKTSNIDAHAIVLIPTILEIRIIKRFLGESAADPYARIGLPFDAS
jgi:hypothetical protein